MIQSTVYCRPMLGRQCRPNNLYSIITCITNRQSKMAAPEFVTTIPWRSSNSHKYSLPTTVLTLLVYCMTQYRPTCVVPTNVKIPLNVTAPDKCQNIPRQMPQRTTNIRTLPRQMSQPTTFNVTTLLRQMSQPTTNFTTLP